jgi:hypothetical protein
MTDKIFTELKKRSNPKWPPDVGSTVVVKQEFRTGHYIGDVIENIWNNTASVILLRNNKNYVELSLINEPKYKGAKGIFLLLPLYAWQYIPSAIEIDVILPESQRIPSAVTEFILDKLRSNKMHSHERTYVVDKTIAIDNIITSAHTETKEGNKIMKWLDRYLISRRIHNIYVFDDLRMYIRNGYVIISRNGIPITDIITPSNTPNLSQLTWQYNISIDHETLRSILSQESDMQQHREAEHILSQEYVICLQPQPIYQIWCLKRLLMCWYADPELRDNIRKIAVIINQWRCKSNKQFNKKNNTMPSIVIFPKYGKKSSSLVINKLSDYFMFCRTLGWTENVPDYFTKLNDILYYSNSALLKIDFLN